MKKISVIVPIYRIERYVGLCIESIMNQTYKNLEIILVDDGSPDRCPEICDLYAKKDSRIKVVHKQNGGLVSARKAGLQVSTGDYVGYVDGDDWIGQGFYESLYTSIESTKSDISCAGQSRDLFESSSYFTNSLPSGIYEGERLEYLLMNMLSYGEFYRPGITTYVWNKLFRREVLIDAQMNVDERISIGEDAAVTYPALLKCNRVCVTDNVAYHYRQREDSMLKQSASFSDEAKKLRYLYDYMIGFAEKQDEKYGLIKQVTDYVLGICIMRSGGRIPLKEDSFSVYDKAYYGKKIIIYSAGTFGQQLMKRFAESKHCEVVKWIDDDYREYRRCGLDVDSIEDINKTDFDYIMIATIDCNVADSIKRQLYNYGVSEKKILTVECEDRELLLKQFMEM